MQNKTLPLILYLLIGILLLNSCESHFPSGRLTVKGEVVDEIGNPIGGIGLNLSGIDQRSITQLIHTFDVSTITDKDGKYEMSENVPSNTNWVDIDIIDYQSFIDGVF